MAIAEAGKEDYSVTFATQQVIVKGRAKKQFFLILTNVSKHFFKEYKSGGRLEMKK